MQASRALPAPPPFTLSISPLALWPSPSLQCYGWMDSGMRDLGPMSIYTEKKNPPPRVKGL